MALFDMLNFKRNNPNAEPTKEDMGKMVEAMRDGMYRLAKTAKVKDDRPEPGERKGVFRFLNNLTNKKQPRIFALNAATLRRLANSDPVIWSIRRTIKSYVNQAEWDIVVDTENIEAELDRWENYAIAFLSPYAVNHTKVVEFSSTYVPAPIAAEIKGRLKEIFNSPLADTEKKKAIKYCFSSATRRVKEEAESHRPEVKRIFDRPSTRGIESNWRALQELVVDDLLVYDAGCIVKNYNRAGELAELYTIPGHEVSLYRNEDRTIPQPPEAAYVWQEKGIIRAEFNWDELIYVMQNPQENGYGQSPMEVAMYITVASLYADEYNIDYFKNSNVPPGVLNLGEEVTEEQRGLFKTMWDNEVRGRGGLHKMLFMSGAKNPSFIPMRLQNNREMQMMEYLKWTMAIKTACYGLSPQDIGFTQDMHRTSSETQQELSQARGVRNILHLLENYYNDEIVKKEFGFTDVKFAWQDVDITDKEKEAKIDVLDIGIGALSINERRRKLGLKPVDGGDENTMQAGMQPVRMLEDTEENLMAAGGTAPGQQPGMPAKPGAPAGQDGVVPEKKPPFGGTKPGQPAAGQDSGQVTGQVPGGLAVKPIPIGQGKPAEGEPSTKSMVDIKVSRRKSTRKQHEIIEGVVAELQKKGVDATVKISFGESDPVEKGDE